MHFGEIVAPTIKELFIQKIEELILSGKLAIGEKLPSERELALHMKISKTIVHEGIKDMERKGFLQVLPRKGILVADYAKNGTLETLTSIMQMNGGRLDRRNVQSIIEIRLALETLAIRKVASDRTEYDLNQLYGILQQAEAVANQEPVNYSELAMQYFLFHHYVCFASGNTITPLILNAFKIPALSFWECSARKLGATESIHRLRLFYQFIESKDSDSAVNHLERIIGNSIDITIEA